MLHYATGCLEELSPIYDIDEVVMTIIQPRIGNISVWSVPAAYLRGYIEDVQVAAAAVAEAEKFHIETGGFRADLFGPSDKACRWCRAKAECPALMAEADRVVDEFADISRLTPANIGEAMGKVALIRAWCDAVEAKTADRIIRGVSIPGWKLVRGRGGNRKWNDPDLAAKALMAAGLKDPFTKVLLTPADVEKKLKKVDGWPEIKARLDALVYQSEGKPTLVSESDKRPAMTLADDFEDLTENSQEEI
jgi:hypothetical protein